MLKYLLIPTIFVKECNIPKLLAQISSYKWQKFIVNQIGGCEGHGCGSLLQKIV